MDISAFLQQMLTPITPASTDSLMQYRRRPRLNAAEKAFRDQVIGNAAQRRAYRTNARGGNRPAAPEAEYRPYPEGRLNPQRRTHRDWLQQVEPRAEYTPDQRQEIVDGLRDVQEDLGNFDFGPVLDTILALSEDAPPDSPGPVQMMDWALTAEADANAELFQNYLWNYGEEDEESKQEPAEPPAPIPIPPPPTEIVVNSDANRLDTALVEREWMPGDPLDEPTTPLNQENNEPEPPTRDEVVEAIQELVLDVQNRLENVSVVNEIPNTTITDVDLALESAFGVRGSGPATRAAAKLKDSKGRAMVLNDELFTALKRDFERRRNIGRLHTEYDPYYDPTRWKRVAKNVNRFITQDEWNKMIEEAGQAKSFDRPDRPTRNKKSGSTAELLKKRMGQTRAATKKNAKRDKRGKDTWDVEGKYHKRKM